MADQSTFFQAIKDGYTFKGESFQLGIGMLDKASVVDAKVMLKRITIAEGLPDGNGTGAKRR